MANIYTNNAPATVDALSARGADVQSISCPGRHDAPRNLQQDGTRPRGQYGSNSDGGRHGAAARADGAYREGGIGTRAVPRARAGCSGAASAAPTSGALCGGHGRHRTDRVAGAHAGTSPVAAAWMLRWGLTAMPASGCGDDQGRKSCGGCRSGRGGNCSAVLSGPERAGGQGMAAPGLQGDIHRGSMGRWACGQTVPVVCKAQKGYIVLVGTRTPSLRRRPQLKRCGLVGTWQLLPWQAQTRQHQVRQPWTLQRRRWQL